MNNKDKQRAHYKIPIEGELIVSPYLRRVARVVSIKKADKEGFYWIEARVLESKDYADRGWIQDKHKGEMTTILFSDSFHMNHSNCYKAIIDIL